MHVRGCEGWRDGAAKVDRSKHNYSLVFTEAGKAKEKNLHVILRLDLHWHDIIANEWLPLLEVTLLSFLTAASSSTAPKSLARGQAASRAQNPSATLHHR